MKSLIVILLLSTGSASAMDLRGMEHGRASLMSTGEPTAEQMASVQKQARQIACRQCKEEIKVGAFALTVVSALVGLYYLFCYWDQK